MSPGARLLRPRSSATTHVPAGSASGRRGGFNFRPPGRVHHPDEPDGHRGKGERWGGRYLPPHPSAPPRPNLDRPVWGPYNALRPYRSRGKEAAAAASFPLGEGLGWTNVQPRLRLVWAWLNLYPDYHFTRGKGRTLGQGHCHWYVCRPGQVFGHPWTRPGHTTTYYY